MLGASLLGNSLTGKRSNIPGKEVTGAGAGTIRADEGTIRAYLRNLDEYESIGTHWIVLYVSGNNLTYFASFGI